MENVGHNVLRLSAMRTERSKQASNQDKPKVRLYLFYQQFNISGHIIIIVIVITSTIATAAYFVRYNYNPF